MATTKIVIKNNKIEEVYDRYFKSLSDDGKEYYGNGWHVVIKNGKIICHAEREYSDGPMSCHREFKLSDGMLGLAGGHISERYAYFRSKKFQDFLEQNGITAVKKINPNSTYTIRNARYGGGECSMSIQTDGNLEDLSYDLGRTEEWQEEFPGTCASEKDETVKVTEARWVIVTKTQHEHNCHNSSRILYTLEDVFKLDLH